MWLQSFYYTFGCFQTSAREFPHSEFISFCIIFLRTTSQKQTHYQTKASSLINSTFKLRIFRISSTYTVKLIIHQVANQKCTNSLQENSQLKNCVKKMMASNKIFFFFFLRQFQPMMSVLENNSLLSDQDTNRFLVQT